MSGGAADAIDAPPTRLPVDADTARAESISFQLEQAVIKADLKAVKELLEPIRKANDPRFMDYLHVCGRKARTSAHVEYEHHSTLLILAIKGKGRVRVSSFVPQRQTIGYQPDLKLCQYLASVGCNPAATDCYQEWTGWTFTSAIRYCTFLSLEHVARAITDGVKEYANSFPVQFRQRELLAACLRRDWTSMKEIIETAPSPEQRSNIVNYRSRAGDLPGEVRKGVSALQLAVETWNIEAVQGLFEYDIELSPDDHLVLKAVQCPAKGREEAVKIVRFLLSKGVGIGQLYGRANTSPLVVAVAEDHLPSMVEALVEYGAHPGHYREDGGSSMYLMQQRRQRFKYRSRFRANAMLEAVNRGAFKFVEKLKSLALRHTSLEKDIVEIVMKYFIADDGDLGRCECGCAELMAKENADAEDEPSSPPP